MEGYMVAKSVAVRSSQPAWAVSRSTLQMQSKLGWAGRQRSMGQRCEEGKNGRR